MSITYKDSGVDIDQANKAKTEMKSILKTDEKRVLNKVGAFSALYDIDFPEYKHPVLVLKTEEPGSKQLLAFQHDKIESVCYDTVNHLINDCIVMGAKPLTVQDAIICGKLESDKVKRMVRAFASACEEQDCVLTGGETSEQPGVIPVGTYILTTSIVGIAEKENIIDGTKITAGDVVLGLESSGLHTNGYTLIRKLIEQNPYIINEIIIGKTFLELILEPHRCYYQTIKDLFPRNIITGLAHITGGGIKENLNRILPDNLDAEIVLSQYQILPIFKFIKNLAGLDDAEMLRTFNMSVGLTMVVKPEHVGEVINHIKEKNVNCYEIGKIIPGNKEVKTINNLIW
ncbi:MAG: phosphoribosylformylglycinamidine cyclo-ligase [Candidatus Magasanikiibacteriota bacterium]